MVDVIYVVSTYADKNHRLRHMMVTAILTPITVNNRGHVSPVLPVSPARSATVYSVWYLNFDMHMTVKDLQLIHNISFGSNYIATHNKHNINYSA